MGAFEITEVDDVPMQRSKVILLLARASGKSIGSIILEELDRHRHEEFWSDPCWTE